MMHFYLLKSFIITLDFKHFVLLLSFILTLFLILFLRKMLVITSKNKIIIINRKLYNIFFKSKNNKFYYFNKYLNFNSNSVKDEIKTNLEDIHKNQDDKVILKNIKNTSSKNSISNLFLFRNHLCLAMDPC